MGESEGEVVELSNRFAASNTKGEQFKVIGEELSDAGGIIDDSILMGESARASKILSESKLVEADMD